MNSSKKKEEQNKLSRSKSEVKKQGGGGGGKSSGNQIKRINTDKKEISAKKYRQYQKNRTKKSKSPNRRPPNQKIQNWGLEFYQKSEDGIQDIGIREKIYEILTGETHMFFLTKNKSVYGLGNNEYGQLGLPNISVIQRPQLLPFSQKISVNRLFVGSDFSFCITTSHQVYSWGLNLKGQLGLGHFENVQFPTLVKSLSRNKKKSKNDKIKKKVSLLQEGEVVFDISCGALHSIALTNKSRVFSCGFGENFSLGHNSNKTLNQFKEIAFFHQLSTSSSSYKIEKICSGTSHSGALVSGKVYIWGTFAHSKYCLNKIPNAIHLNQSVIDFVLGDLLTVILADNGEVYTLGENTDGQLGVAQVSDYNMIKVDIPCKVEFICCGLNHVIAINNNEGRIFGWGSNQFGQIHPNSTAQMFTEPFELPWMFKAKAYIITCGPFSTVLVSAKKAKVPSHGGNDEDLETMIELKKQIESIKKKAKRINAENEKLKDEISTLHDTINSHMDSFNGSTTPDKDTEHDSDSK
jgi:mitogen-activated protein kinase kinase kinase 9